MNRQRRNAWQTAATLLLVAAAVAVARGIYVGREIKDVPIERLAQNLQRQIEEKPDNVGLRLNLARLYAMAYALKATEFSAAVMEDDRLQPWFGHNPPHMPGPVQPSHSREQDDRAKRDLERAIKAYADVVARAPSSAIAQLGYAWSLEQAGRKVEAVAAYRKVVELAWPNDVKQQAFWVEPATAEAAERLIELLDPVADAKEIASLEEKQEALLPKGRMITPIAIPLQGDAEIVPVDPDARVAFDADGSGVLRTWTWIRHDAGWLVHDPHGAGRITSALQWFGNVTFWLFWTNGYEALAALDDDADGELRGAELRQLAIWRDANQNGTSDAGEVRPLSAYRIAALSCAWVEGDGRTLAAYSPRGVVFDDGTTRATYDVMLHETGRHTTLTEAPN